jgi:probable rRNA maturation factor
MSPSPRRRSATPLIDIQVTSPLWKTEPAAEDTVRAAIAAASAACPAAACEVSVLLTGDSGIRKLNRDWRGIDKPTNVLSFPAAAQKADKTAALLGDIVIAFETLKAECEDEDRIFLHHLAHLTVHGFLHLLGYDHQTDSDADEMEGLESKIMSTMKMPDPYLARDLGES